MDSYVPLATLGEGGFGIVYKARNKRTGEMVAVKKIKSRRAATQQQQQQQQQICQLPEVLAMRSIAPHPNLIRLKDAHTHEDQTFLILDLMKQSVTQLLRVQGAMDESRVRNFTWQLLKGVSHIHLSGFMHRDIKPDNLLLDNYGVLKISDFGGARLHPFSAAGAAQSAARPADPYSTSVGTLWYNAPEVLACAHRYGPAVDMWSVGCTIAELFTGKPIFPGTSVQTQINIVKSVLGWRRDLSLAALLPSASSQAVQLVAALLSLDPAMRPTALEALRHPFFQPCRQAEALVSGVPLGISEDPLQNKRPMQRVSAASLAGRYVRCAC